MSHIKSDINPLNNKVLLSLDSCLIQAVLTIPLPKLKLVENVLSKLPSHILQSYSLTRPVDRHVRSTYQNNTRNLCCNAHCRWIDICFVDTFVTSVLSKYAYK